MPCETDRISTAARGRGAIDAPSGFVPLESANNRHQKNVGKKHVIPPYERTGMAMGGAAQPGGGRVGGGGGGGARRQPGQGSGGVQAKTGSWARAPPGDPLLHSSGNLLETFGSGRRAAAANGPGYFLRDLGRQVAESGAAGGVAFSPGSRGDGGCGGVGGGAGSGGATAGPGRLEDGPRRKELYAQN